MNLIADQVSLCFESPEEKLGDLLTLGYEKRKAFPDEIHFYAPGMVHYETSFHLTSNPYRFPAVSVTGRICQLQCEHCKLQPAVNSRLNDSGGCGTTPLPSTSLCTT